jgi:hypothetical protein
VTAQAASGLTGPATVLYVVVEGPATADVERDLDLVAPHGFRTSSVLRSAIGGPRLPRWGLRASRLPHDDGLRALTVVTATPE